MSEHPNPPPLSSLIGQTVRVQNRRFPAGHNVRVVSIIPGTRVMKAIYRPSFSPVYVCESELGGAATYPHSPEEQDRMQRILNKA